MDVSENWQAISVFFASLIYIFLITLQIKNVQFNNIVGAGLTSLLIGGAHIITINGIVSKGWKCRVAYSLGACTGVMSGVVIGGVVYG